MTRTVVFFVFLVLVAACGDKQAPAEPARTESPALAKMTLVEEPGPAISVEDAIDAAPKEEVIVEGRVRKIVPGYASFQLTDVFLDYCGSGNDSMEKCPTPWDYCCLPQSEVNLVTLVVEARDEDNKVLAAEKLQGLRLLDLVVVTGKLGKDEHGNVRIDATGWYRRERPTLHDRVVWPE